MQFEIWEKHVVIHGEGCSVEVTFEGLSQINGIVAREVVKREMGVEPNDAG